jgi:hypothetical protein
VVRVWMGWRVLRWCSLGRSRTLASWRKKWWVVWCCIVGAIIRRVIVDIVSLQDEIGSLVGLYYGFEEEELWCILLRI